ncbi:D-serine deaminase, pyridoxal phosphate-dependent [Halobacillus karajensis]|uniref:D-threonine aldolase n=1 Tax=Halobacillus karajensis TaxID=195088 RepID=A0A024P612_9BACI|nr:alanine racemase [Halobacillus karajensis]CDQ18153.1 D-threonine aldolase [Halobacillus karajensis]CDQ24504.1 D-threonine aldolase [Halobacillus karajensis]CDQ29248.1 D-threonine aldolase [Halobacillus karajensis]SEH58261.1 D-serine deaminase, pyridoxal phosphate-dependent [Halobacillus karajensis]
MDQTPYIVIDEKILVKNIRKMSRLAIMNKVNLRPHIKTHKIPHIAKLQLAEGAVGITVAKISEAKVMASYGINDIFIAYPIVSGAKAREICVLNKKISKLIVGVDSIDGARVLNEYANKYNQTIKVRLEIDTGLERTGVGFQEALVLAKTINQLEFLSLEGIFTFKGPVYKGKATKDVQKAGREEGELMVEVATKLRNAGIRVEDISVGSTPTASSAATVDGITEIRPGTYVFNDAMQVNLGVSEWGDCAAKVVSTVVSRPSDKRAVIDGGSKTFATDVQPNCAPLYLLGFGSIQQYPKAQFARMNEEHGVIMTNGSTLKIGEKLSIIPNHICSTINLHNYVYLKRGENDYEKLTVEARGMVQ